MEQKSSLKKQIEFYREYIQRNPSWQLVAAYFDTASGLQSNHRPGYQQMLQDCRKKKIDLI
ncbi:MAG TPA: recombinase family protein [Firmicutes bacterium]|nr:recombinase family protein [Bacillota bacterium]